mgnify:CR=1 FL=1
MRAQHDRPRIYTVGPFSATTELERRRNIARAEEAALELARHGAYYRCPHLDSAHFDGQIGDGYWLELGLDLLSECDAAYLVADAPAAPPCTDAGPQRAYLRPEWPLWLSYGSVAEVAWCEAHNVPMLTRLAEAVAFIRRWRPGSRP